jgi:TPR repeat protein
MATATKHMNWLRHLTLALITACSAAFAQAATLDEAAAASARGDHETAVRVYGTLAARGDAEAQFNLGLMHAQFANGAAKADILIIASVYANLATADEAASQAALAAAIDRGDARARKREEKT